MREEICKKVGNKFYSDRNEIDSDGLKMSHVIEVLVF